MIVVVYILSIVSIVCDVMVLIPLFKKEGVLKGILAVICGLYSFIWGWMHVKDEGLKLKNVMYVWTAVVVLQIIASVAMNAMQASGG